MACLAKQTRLFRIRRLIVFGIGTDINASLHFAGVKSPALRIGLGLKVLKNRLGQG